MMLTAYSKIHPKVIQIYPEQLPATSKSSLFSEVGQDVPYIRALPGGMALQLALLSDKKPELGFASLYIVPFLTTTLNRSIPYLPVQENSGMVIASQDYFRAETANSLAQLRYGGYG